MEHRALEQLRELDELRRRFLSNMSRELRMPLNNIIGFSRVILKGIDGPINDVQRDDLTAIHDSGQQLLALINDILDIAQIEAGAMELSIQEADYGDIARSVIPTSNALLEGRPVQFTWNINPDLPTVMADPLRLRQVLVKLLSNAAKFTPQGEIALNVWCDDGEIITTITDTGIGIPEQDREKVFELFRQGSQAKCRDSGGTGMGLTFSREIVEMHGGTIWLDSQEGHGTSFTIILPAVEPQPVAE
jgi:signal transduction histidine kinase